MKVHTFKVAGVTFDGRQETLSKLRGNEVAQAVPEPENPHDSNAIAIKVAFEGKVYHVGYMPRQEAALFAPLFEGEPFLGRVLEVSGGFEKWDGSRASYGLLVTFELPEQGEVESG